MKEQEQQQAWVRIPQSLFDEATGSMISAYAYVTDKQRRHGGLVAVLIEELAEAVGFDRSTASRALSGLRSLGYITQDETHHYWVEPRDEPWVKFYMWQAVGLSLRACRVLAKLRVIAELGKEGPHSLADLGPSRHTTRRALEDLVKARALIITGRGNRRHYEIIDDKPSDKVPEHELFTVSIRPLKSEVGADEEAPASREADMVVEALVDLTATMHRKPKRPRPKWAHDIDKWLAKERLDETEVIEWLELVRDNRMWFASNIQSPATLKRWFNEQYDTVLALKVTSEMQALAALDGTIATADVKFYSELALSAARVGLTSPAAINHAANLYRQQHPTWHFSARAVVKHYQPASVKPDSSRRWVELDMDDFAPDGWHLR